MQRLSITYKLTLLLALLSTAPLVFLLFGRTGEELRIQVERRFAACEQVALGCAITARAKDYESVAILLEQFVQRNKDIAATRLVRFDGLVIHQNGDHEANWESDGATTSKHIRIPIYRANQTWGYLETSFSNDLADSRLKTIVKAIVMTLSLNMLTFGILLRRSLSVLDSGNAVPRRVKNTLDTIVGGVVILNQNGKIVMANEAFQKSSRRPIDTLIGTDLRTLPFRCPNNERYPWETAMDTNERQSGKTIFLSVDGSDAELCFVVNATPIFDAKESLAGSLISFEDVTTLEKQKQSLISALSELEVSKDQIYQQNVRLQELASKDALTGAWNRRSLFEQLENHWQRIDSHGEVLNCIMLDVDHFKKLNDNHGHAVGDQVLKDVARTLKEAVGDIGIVGRYGGEEFCVILPVMNSGTATEVGEKIREAIEVQLKDPYRVTASFGVSSSEFGADTFQHMLEQADQALYWAKHGGRNAVRCWNAEIAAAEENAEAPVKIVSTYEQPISYHAVASLHAALAYRDADTALHSQRVAEMSVSLGRGLMPVSQLYVLEIGAILHDIGKIGVPDSILLKPGKLDPEEWKIMEAHARMGVEIVDSSFNSAQLSDIVRYHHYRFDGANSPAGCPVGQDIPLGARIVCIVDAYDAMVSDRVYRKGRSPEEAFAELRRCAGTQFDPELVERFIHMQVGWRPDSRFVQSDLEDRLAISIGHLTERTMSAFESKDMQTLSDSLNKLTKLAERYEMTAIRHLSAELNKAIADARTDDWEFAVPILQNLLDMCLMVQRAHIREVASRPQVTENCPQSHYFEQARAWVNGESATAQQ